MPREDYHTVDGVAAVVHHAGLDPKEFGLDKPDKGTLDAVRNQLEPSGRRTSTIRDINNEDHLREDLEELKSGVLDPNSFVQGYVPQEHPVEYLVHDSDGNLKQRIHSHNVRTNIGGELQGLQLGGDTLANNGVVLTYSAATVTATSILGTGIAGLPTTRTSVTGNEYLNGGYVGRLIVIGGVYGIITANTATTIYVDKWHTPGTDATGATPATSGTATIVPAVSPFYYMALSNNNNALPTVDNGDTGNLAINALTTRWQTLSATQELAGNGLDRKYAAISTTSPVWFSGQTSNGTATYTTGATPGGTAGTTTNAGAFKLVVQYTATAGASVYASGLFNTAVNNGTGSNTPYQGAQGVLVFEASLGTAATLASGDTLTVTWQIQY